MFALLTAHSFPISNNMFLITCNNKILCILYVSIIIKYQIWIPLAFESLFNLFFLDGGCQFTWWHRDNHLFRWWNSNVWCGVCGAGASLVVTCYILFFVLPPVGSDKWLRLAFSNTARCMLMHGRNVLSFYDITPHA